MCLNKNKYRVKIDFEFCNMPCFYNIYERIAIIKFFGNFLGKLKNDLFPFIC